MLDYMLTEGAKERHERMIHDAETFRQALRSKKVQKISPILKSLIIFLIAVA
jgi:hypothetical protein